MSCHKQEAPLFDPSLSSTYASISFAPPLSATSSSASPIAPPPTACMASSTVTARSSPTYTKYCGVFSYCLPFTSRSVGYLAFGSYSAANLLSTPMLSNPSDPTSYYLALTSISVNGQLLAVCPSIFAHAGTIINSGTVITQLPATAYSALRVGLIVYKQLHGSWLNCHATCPKPPATSSLSWRHVKASLHPCDVHGSASWAWAEVDPFCCILLSNEPILASIHAVESKGLTNHPHQKKSTPSSIASNQEFCPSILFAHAKRSVVQDLRNIITELHPYNRQSSLGTAS
ncbi:hypothetical protein ZIOFF_034564 [Zingiber officinale]|uniref:Xylanase inhibitor C-terminal domain-containing protein n=1 Tax=Zingiber officinale TaxID=94328 RepID=A0A8J5GYD2_ZINOF|nr:hypothetical protein ZIOFF_034564 [Zingiber officinale]